MQESARERKAASRRGPVDERAEGELEVRAKIAEMPTADRAMAERIHELVTTTAPSLVPRTYYGMPAYAKDGKVICFFKPASKFRAHATARIPAGRPPRRRRPVAGLVRRDQKAPRSEARIGELVKKAVG